MNVVAWMLCAAVSLAGSTAVAQTSPEGLAEKSRAFQKGLDRVEDDPFTPAFALKKSRAKTAAQIFAWVRDNVDYEPYSGELRGARGVLVDHVGNSVDQATLLVAMFRAKGLNARFARGRKSAEETQRVLSDFAGKASLLNPANLDNQAPKVADPTTTPRYASNITEHVWAEVLVGDTWVAADPVLADKLGPNGLQVLDRATQLWDDLQSRFEISVEVELEDGQKKKLVAWRGNALDAADGLRLTFNPHVRISDAVVPALAHRDQITSGEYFPKSQVTRLVANVRVRRGMLETRLVETLASKDEKRPVFTFDQAYFGFALFNTYGTPQFSRDTTQRALHAASDAMLSWASVPKDTEVATDARPYLNSIHEGLPHAIAASYLTHLDTLAKELAFGLGVRPLLLEPRFATTVLLRKDETYSVRMNVRDYGLDAMPRKGVPQSAATGFLTMVGRIDAQLHGAIIGQVTDEDVLTIDKFFDAAAAARTPVISVDSRSTAKLSKVSSDTAALKEAIRRRGGIGLLPSRPVDINGASLSGYWMINPETGHLSGSVGGGLVSAIAPAAANKAVAGRAAFALMNRLLIVSDNTEQTQAHLGIVCASRTDILRLNQAFCATSTAMPLPEVNTCLADPAAAPLDVASAGTCEQRTRTSRCGAVVASALLTGELTALYDMGSQTRAFGLTCRGD